MAYLSFHFLQVYCGDCAGLLLLLGLLFVISLWPEQTLQPVFDHLGKRGGVRVKRAAGKVGQMRAINSFATSAFLLLNSEVQSYLLLWEILLTMEKTNAREELLVKNE